MSSALLNRMVHVHLKASHREWLEWAAQNGIHPLILDYIGTRPDHLWSQPPKHEEPFSTPRAWHILSDALHSYGDNITLDTLEVLAYGCLTPHHAGQFKAFVKQVRSTYRLAAIVQGDSGWPHAPEDRDILYFLAQSFRAQLIKELPPEKKDSRFAHRAKALLKDLASINLEIAQLVVVVQDGEGLPRWFMTGRPSKTACRARGVGLCPRPLSPAFRLWACPRGVPTAGMVRGLRLVYGALS
jgi:hypothetical protein